MMVSDAFARVGRQNKAKKLWVALVKLALQHGHNLRDSRQRAHFAELLRDGQYPLVWAECARLAGCKPPSAETIRLVLERLE